MSVHADGNYVVNCQERVQQLERQLKEMEREKERELNALRKEKRDLVHTTQTVRGINDTEHCHITVIGSLICLSSKPYTCLTFKLLETNTC